MKKHEFKSLIRECIDEIVSDQMVGIQEVMQFYSKAPMDKIIEVDELIAGGDNHTAWSIIEKFLSSVGLLVKKSIGENRLDELNWKRALATAALTGATLFGSDVEAANYKIKSGDNLSSVAKTHHTSVDKILKLNPFIKNANNIRVGMKIEIPSTAVNKPTAKKSDETPMAISSNSFIDYLKNVENSVKSGYKNGKWYPHKSVEGGSDTIAYGHKLKKGENFSSGLTDSEADDLLKKDMEIARQTIRREIKKYGVSMLSPEKEEMLIDFSFNLGTIHKFPKFVGAIVKDDWGTAKEEYKRYTGGKELKNRNEEFYKRFLLNK